MTPAGRQLLDAVFAGDPSRTYLASLVEEVERQAALEARLARLEAWRRVATVLDDYGIHGSEKRADIAVAILGEN